MGEKLLFRPGPELTHVLVGLDGLVPELESVFDTFRPEPPDEEAPHDVAEVIELDRSARRILEVDCAHCSRALVFIAGVTADRLEASVHHLATDIHYRGILARNGIVILQHALDEAIVAASVEIDRVRGAADKTDRLLAEAFEQSVVATGLTTYDRIFQPSAGIGLHEAQRVRAGKALTDAIAIADLRNVGGVVGRHQRWPQFVNDAAAVLLESGLESAHLLIAEGKVLGDGDDALEFHFGRRIVSHRLHRLR